MSKQIIILQWSNCLNSSHKNTLTKILSTSFYKSGSQRKIKWPDPASKLSLSDFKTSLLSTIRYHIYPVSNFLESVQFLGLATENTFRCLSARSSLFTVVFVHRDTQTVCNEMALLVHMYLLLWRRQTPWQGEEVFIFANGLSFNCLSLLNQQCPNVSLQTTARLR